MVAGRVNVYSIGPLGRIDSVIEPLGALLIGC